MVEGNQGRGQLVISPQELKFRFELKKQIFLYVSLTNQTEERIVFKVRTTSPRRYVVKPSMSFVEPNSTVQVQICMQPQKEYPDFNCKDKFQVLSALIAADYALQNVPTSIFEDSNPNLSKTKLRVVLDPPPAPPSPVPEGNEDSELHAYATIGSALQPAALQVKNKFQSQSQQPANANAGQPDDPAAIIQQRNKLASDLDSFRSENNRLKQQLYMRDQQSKQQSVGAGPAAINNSYSLLSLVMTAMVSFVLGWLVHHYQMSTKGAGF